MLNRRFEREKFEKLYRVHNELRSRIGQLSDEGFFLTLDQLERASELPPGAELRATDGVAAEGDAASQHGANMQSRLPTRHTKVRKTVLIRDPLSDVESRVVCDAMRCDDRLGIGGPATRHLDRCARRRVRRAAGRRHALGVPPVLRDAADGAADARPRDRQHRLHNRLLLLGGTDAEPTNRIFARV